MAAQIPQTGFNSTDVASSGLPLNAARSSLQVFYDDTLPFS